MRPPLGFLTEIVVVTIDLPVDFQGLYRSRSAYELGWRQAGLVEDGVARIMEPELRFGLDAALVVVVNRGQRSVQIIGYHPKDDGVAGGPMVHEPKNGLIDAIPPDPHCEDGPAGLLCQKMGAGNPICPGLAVGGLIAGAYRYWPLNTFEPCHQLTLIRLWCVCVSYKTE